MVDDGLRVRLAPNVVIFPDTCGMYKHLVNLGMIDTCEINVGNLCRTSVKPCLFYLCPLAKKGVEKKWL